MQTHLAVKYQRANTQEKEEQKMQPVVFPTNITLWKHACMVQRVVINRNAAANTQ